MGQPDNANLPMDPHYAAMRTASGEVNDKRRFVQFLYLLLRDGVASAGGIGDAHRQAAEHVPKPDESTWEDGVRGVAGLLVDRPHERLYFFVRHLLGQQEHNTVAETLQQVPTQDDNEARFTNGWLAQYCQWVADDFERMCSEEKRPLST